jgi:hypothetical protein
MRKHDAKTIAFNLSGATVISVVVVYMVQSFLTTPKVELCSKRYAQGQQFALDDENGKPLSPIELQARMGMKEWGVLSNASVSTRDAASGTKSISIKLDKAEGGQQNDGESNGASFTWPVASLSSARAACLSYDVKLPNEFQTGIRLRLPGVAAIGAPPLDNSGNVIEDAEPRDLAFNIGISTRGDVGVEVSGVAGQSMWLGGTRYKRMEIGDWVKVEQEVVWNDPGKDNGTVRVWMNGRLVIDNQKVNLRRLPEQYFTGVNAETRYVARELGKPIAIEMTPFIVQWKK